MVQQLVVLWYRACGRRVRWDFRHSESDVTLRSARRGAAPNRTQRVELGGVCGQVGAVCVFVLFDEMRRGDCVYMWAGTWWLPRVTCADCMHARSGGVAALNESVEG